MIKFKQLSIPGVFLFEPHVFKDDRGFFFESFNKKEFEEIIEKKIHFVQDNHSRSSCGVLRGLHYQNPPFEQGKLIRVLSGEIFDVAVDIRVKSDTFGQWISANLSCQNKKQLWIPPGFAHGFLVLSKFAEIAYKVTEYYKPEFETCIAYNDYELNIEWPNLNQDYILSKKDKKGILLSSFK